MCIFIFLSSLFSRGYDLLCGSILWKTPVTSRTVIELFIDLRGCVWGCCVLYWYCWLCMGQLWCAELWAQRYMQTQWGWWNRWLHWTNWPTSTITASRPPTYKQVDSGLFFFSFHLFNTKQNDLKLCKNLHFCPLHFEKFENLILFLQTPLPHLRTSINKFLFTLFDWCK